MDTEQLRTLLRRDGVPDEDYVLDVSGTVDPDQLPGLDDVHVLTKAPDGWWYVAYLQRGDAVDKLPFRSEGDACTYLAGLLGRPATTEQTARDVDRHRGVEPWPRPVRYLVLAAAAVLLSFGVWSLVSSGTTEAAQAGLRVALSVGIAGVVGALVTAIGAARRVRRARRTSERSHDLGPPPARPDVVHRDRD